MDTANSPVATSPSQILPELADALPPSESVWDVYVVGRRLLAVVLDIVMVYVVVTIVSALVRLPALVDLLAPYLGFLAYKIVTEALRGETLGKRIMGIAVRDWSGGPIGWVPSIVRNLMLIPGAFLLYIPTLAMMEFSLARQRLGDRMAKTIVVRAQHGAPMTRRALTTTGRPDVPAIQAGAPLVMAQSAQRDKDLRRLVVGSVALAATTMIATVIFTVDLTICSQTGIRHCDGDFDAPVWFGSTTAHNLAIVSAVLALIGIPFVVGWVAKKWVWTLVSGCVCAGAFIVGMFLGFWTVGSWYADYLSDSTDNAGGAVFYFLMLIVGPPIPVIFALLGTLVDMGVGKLRT